MNILRIDSSMRHADSISRQLADEVVQTLSGAKVTVRDLANTVVPQLNEQWIGANFTPADERSAEQHEVLALSDQLIAEIKSNDLLLIGVPIYNFGIPAALKAWVDQICRAGVTFQYTSNDPEGLLEGKRAIIVLASGGVPKGSPMDFASPHIEQVMNFIGINDVTFIEADNNFSDPNKARAQITGLPRWLNL